MLRMTLKRIRTIFGLIRQPLKQDLILAAAPILRYLKQWLPLNDFQVLVQRCSGPNKPLQPIARRRAPAERRRWAS